MIDMIRKYKLITIKFVHYCLTYLMLLSLSLSVSSFLLKNIAKNFYLKFDNFIDAILLLILGIAIFLFTKFYYTPPKYLDHLD